MPYCLACGSMVDEYDSGYYSRNMACIPCYNRKASETPMASCSKCGVRVRQDEARQRRGSYYCNYCTSEIDRMERLPSCAVCGRKIESFERSVKTVKGASHIRCAEDMQRQGATSAVCSACGIETKFFKILPNNKILCLKCGKKSMSELFGGKPDERAKPMPIIASAMGRIKRMLGH